MKWIKKLKLKKTTKIKTILTFLKKNTIEGVVRREIRHHYISKQTEIVYEEEVKKQDVIIRLLLNCYLCRCWTCFFVMFLHLHLFVKETLGHYKKKKENRRNKAYDGDSMEWMKWRISFWRWNYIYKVYDINIEGIEGRRSRISRRSTSKWKFEEKKWYFSN